MHLIGICLGFIRERLGEEALQDLWRKDFDDLGLASGVFKKMTPEELATAVVTACRFVSSPLPALEGSVPFDVEEDDEKYVISYRHCGSGGLFRREPNSESGQPWPVLEGTHDWAYGEHVNLYCPHCKVLTDMAREQSVGYEVEFGANPPSEPCRYIVRKRPG